MWMPFCTCSVQCNFMLKGTVIAAPTHKFLSPEALMALKCGLNHEQVGEVVAYNDTFFLTLRAFLLHTRWFFVHLPFLYVLINEVTLYVGHFYLSYFFLLWSLCISYSPCQQASGNWALTSQLTSPRRHLPSLSCSLVSLLQTAVAT